MRAAQPGVIGPDPPQSVEAVELFLRDAESHCRKQGGRLTRNRADVLRAIASAREPLTAYAIVAALRISRAAAPAMVYRSLDFLTTHHLVRHVLTANAYIACLDASARTADAALFVCDQCSRAESVADGRLPHDFDATAAGIGFRIAGRVMEARGLCAGCLAAATARR